MLGSRLFAKQSTRDGLRVSKLLVAERVESKGEYYVALTIDRDYFGPALLVSKQGGRWVDVEAQSHDTLLKIQIGYNEGITDDIVLRVREMLRFDSQYRERLKSLLSKMWTLFCQKDMTLFEMNPLVITREDELMYLDTKFTFDNAASKRQQEVFDLRKVDQEDPQELEAAQSGLVYVCLGGNIGNVVNRARLAMATDDAISYYGGQSANFLDAGDQATTETMVKAFEIILRDDRVKVILVNIHGGKLSR